MNLAPAGCPLVGRRVRLRDVVLLLVGVLLALGLAAAPAHAEDRTWGHVAQEMADVLDRAGEAYAAGDPEAALAGVNDAYFGYYEKLGFEKTVMAYISGNRAAAVEYQFSEIKKDIAAGAPVEQVTADLNTLKEMIQADADQLDGKEDNPYAALVSSLIIILREGVEAILVVAAVVAYLVKSGHADKTRVVYWGAGAALLASVALAWLLNTITVLSGANQEIIEGATMLLAVVVLVWVSNWILSKSEADAWAHYIRTKSESSLTRGSLFSLAFVAFLAVFREGAETILFYQALLARTSENRYLVWVGMGIGAVILVGVFLAFRFLTVRLPLRPFFLGTSILLALMAFSFAGGAIKEFQEAGVITATPVAGVSSVDLLGIYPTVETLLAQGITLLVIVALSFLGLRSARRQAEEARAAASGADPGTDAPGIEPADARPTQAG